MADGDVAAQNAGEIIGEVKDGVVLDVGIFANDDAVDITAENCIVPNAGMSAESHITKDDGGAGDVNVCADGRAAAQERIELFFKIGHGRKLTEG